VLVLRKGAQRADSELGRVVQVGDTGDRIRGVFQGPGEVREERTVATNLLHGMQHGMATVGVHIAKVIRVLERLGLTPLLEFHQDVRRVARFRVDPRKQRIDSFAREWQLELSQHLNLAEPCLA
jgi:hypothetical protein